jgi:hypothetical protein
MPELRKNMHFTGFIDHKVLPEILPAGDIFPICYLSDNFPGALAEIALSKLPMIAYMKGGIPEMITKNGEILSLNFTAEEKNDAAEKLLKQLIWHYQEPYRGQELADKLNTHIRSNFEKKSIVSKLVSKYLELLRKKNGSY